MPFFLWRIGPKVFILRGNVKKGPEMVDGVLDILVESWKVLMDASVYMLLGLFVAGLIRVFLNPGLVARHLGRGRIRPVLKAALVGIPLPL